MSGGALSFTVWGCRGSLPVSGASHALYGGATTCYALEAEGAPPLVVDCGSGMRALGDAMMAGARAGAAIPVALDILLGHVHFDHLIGLGFFGPLIFRRSALTIWTADDPATVADAIGRLFGPPLWPVAIPGDYPVAVRHIGAEGIRLGPYAVQAFPLNHPGGAHGFRVTAGGASVAIVADHEHGDAAIDRAIAARIHGADLLVYDAAYSSEEYRRKVGWGHSTPDAAARMAAAAGVAHTLLVHHSVTATDAELAALDARLGGRGMSVARDGMTLQVPAA